MDKLKPNLTELTEWIERERGREPDSIIVPVSYLALKGLLNYCMHLENRIDALEEATGLTPDE